MAERIQKVLARAGYGSRRQVETWIKEGRVTRNGELASLGDQISEGDRLKLDNKPLSPKRLWQEPAKQVILYNKPVGEVCTRKDPEGRRTIFQSLPIPEQGRWVSVGRLDLNTSGLIILTTDGELANRLMHPSHEMDREYAVRVLGEVTSEMMQTLRDGVMLEDGEAKFADIQESGGEGANKWYHVVIQEGRNREVRRLWESQGVQVSRLMRVRYGPIIIPNNLRMGHWTKLEGSDLDYLYEQAGMKPVSNLTGGRKKPAVKQERPKKTRTRKEYSTNKKEQSRDQDEPTPKRRPRIRGH
ncbi:MAG TPA: pseudouridine synthase [Methylophaga aminisulfidivorans]|jgi:23S rRNA pseudouridine2605 synthase|uniref:23S rRNA pseudouridine(2605) synthase RluB n=1 Tax=Methylophaga TaxID=40222 RepID=UPI00175509ED|nr:MULTISPECIES: pseudouridine synthase [Methylophaga]HIC47232.1 pseudouridine synthase [Methylophaga sp.]HIM41194.1 pseudouridine synthase [Methylophaga aminisulfidivorans]